MLEAQINTIMKLLLKTLNNLENIGDKIQELEFTNNCEKYKIEVY